MNISPLLYTVRRVAVTRRMVGLVFLLAGLLLGPLSMAQDAEALFKVCATCHKIGGGRLVGPDLANIDQKRSEEWLIRFIRSAQSVINSGDEVALALKKEYNNIIMPDNLNLSDDQIRSLIAYVVSKSPGRDAIAEKDSTTNADEDGEGASEDESGADTAAGAGPVVHADPTIDGRLLSDATEEDLRSGERLFAGYDRFVNEGPSCISCHNINSDRITSGGALAKDLTDCYVRLSGEGTAAIISGLSFPAMKQAYGERPLTDGEVYSLVAFLKQSSETPSPDNEVDYGLQLFLVGCAGTLFLLLFFSGLWFKRKKRTVHQVIFQRQVKSM